MAIFEMDTRVDKLRKRIKMRKLIRSVHIGQEESPQEDLKTKMARIKRAKKKLQHLREVFMQSITREESVDSEIREIRKTGTATKAKILETHERIAFNEAALNMPFDFCDISIVTGKEQEFIAPDKEEEIYDNLDCAFCEDDFGENTMDLINGDSSIIDLDTAVLMDDSFVSKGETFDNNSYVDNVNDLDRKVSTNSLDCGETTLERVRKLFGSGEVPESPGDSMLESFMTSFIQEEPRSDRDLNSLFSDEFRE